MTTQVPLENKIFVNRTLNLNSIKLIGFDMDYTLATYNVPVFEEKAYSIIQDKLIENYDYPEEIRDLKFDKNFIIRGLVIDTENGNVLKVNQFGFVRKASHGTRFFSFEEQKEKFGPKNIDLTDPVYYIIHTLFSLAEGCIYAQLVDYYDDRDIKINYKNLFKDVRKSLNDAHQDETLKGDIVENPEKYLIRDERMIKALKRFKTYGKKIALITNSDYDYSRKVMDYCYGPYLKEPWQDLFDLIIVAANKPAYFTEKS
jgi:HAD superfamily 5'-nucleotidase-like hydrolase